jgi:hypothetical protein
LKIRRTALAGIVAAVLVVGAGCALLFWLPNLVGRRVAAQVEARTGVAAKVDGVSLGALSVRIDQLVVGGGAGELSVRMTELVIQGSPMQLAFRGTDAIAGVTLGGLDVRAPLHAKTTRSLLQRLSQRARAGEQGAAEPPAKGRSRDLRVKRLSLLVSDQHGELVRIQRGSLELTAGRARVALERVQAGQRPGGQVSLQKLGAQASREAAGFRLESATVADVQLWLPALESEHAGADASAVAGGAGAASRPRSSVRLSQALQELVPAERADASATPANAAPVPPQLRAGAASRLLERFASDALVTLEKATVYDGAAGRPILQKLHASMKVQADKVVLFAGDGAAQGGGALGWDLVVRPEQLRADGEVSVKALPLSLLAPMLPSIPWYRPEDARVDASLRIKTAPQEGISFSGEASLRDVAIESARMAPTPIRGIDVGLSGSGRLLPMQRRLELAEAELSLEQARVQMAATMEWGSEHYLFNVDAQLPPTPCNDVVQSVPQDVLGDMALATWRGKLSGEFHLRLDSRQLDDAELDIDPKDQCQFETVPIMADLRRFGRPFVHSVLEPDDTVFEMTTGPGTANWTDIEDISPLFVHAVLAHEDAGFFSHRGFSMRHIRDALVRNLKAGRYVVGASTITMQLVKNVFLHREKTLARKIQEVLLTWWLERVMSKREILELYLNVIEYGPGVYGIRHAARHYFSRSPSELSPAEAVYLSTILPNPKRYHQHLTRGALTAGWTEVVRKMLLRLGERGSYPPETVDFGLSEIASFRFAPVGSVVAPRELPPSAPLPYMQGASGQAAPWVSDDRSFELGEGFDDGLDEPRPAPARRAPAPTSRAFPYPR